MKPSFEMSVDARLLLQELVKASIGHIFTYEDLSKIVSRDVTSSSTCLRRAILRAMRDNGIVFGTVNGVGIKRLSDPEIVDQGADVADRVRRMARRSVERLTKVEFDKLPREKQAEHSARVSIMATLAHMTGANQFERLRGAAALAGRELPIAATLALFTPGGKA